ncbi:MAG: hypothetical protein AAGG46_01820, partial [Planctomycetota bacterium]
LTVACAFALASSSGAFDPSKDMLIAQFDCKPDADDVHAQAALGCMLVHSDLAGINYLVVLGAYGIQGGEYIDTRPLAELAFGQEGFDWTDANSSWNGSRNLIADRAEDVLNNGGQVWVQEAGQSDLTRDWVRRLRNNKGFSQAQTQDYIIVVQHSLWNEDHTSPNDLTYVQQNTTYIKIADGNYSNSTPDYDVSKTKWLNKALDSDNPNAVAQLLWGVADAIIWDHWNTYPNEWQNPNIAGGGVDFSDCVENWYIFDIGSSAGNVRKFWKRYVTNAP